MICCYMFFTKKKGNENDKIGPKKVKMG
jgi:hypothetical protein